MKPAFLETTRRESAKMWRFRTLMKPNAARWYPMYFGTEGKILFWSGDSQEVHLRLRRNIWTYNYVSTIFGGSMFSAADPFYMLMLLRILDKQYVVWDKAGSIRFRRPGRQTLYARYELTDDVLNAIRGEVSANGQTERTFSLQWVDKDGVVHADRERLCYIASKQHYENRKKGDTAAQKSAFNR